MSPLSAKIAEISHFASKYDKKLFKKDCEGAIFSRVPVTLLKIALLYKCFYSVRSICKFMSNIFSKVADSARLY